MQSTKENLLDFYPSSENGVKLGDNSLLPAIGHGSASVQDKLVLKNVLVVPGLAHSLLSVSAVCKTGCSVHFEEHSGYILDRDGRRIANLIQSNGLYRLQTILQSCGLSQSQRTLCPESLKLIHFHKLYGHISLDKVRKISGIQGGKLPFCEGCAKGNQRRRRIRRRPSRKAHQSECNIGKVAADLKDFSGSLGLSNERYILTVIHEDTRYAWGYVLKTKNEATKYIKRVALECKHELKLDIIKFRSDGGSEFTNLDLSQYLLNLGIRSERARPYAHHENGLIEIFNQRIVRMIRSMLADAGLTPGFWPHAVLHAVYLYNHTPHFALDMKCPAELVTPNYTSPLTSKLPIFGSMCYYVPEPDDPLAHRNANPIGLPAIWTGKDSSGHRVFCLTKDTLRRVRNCMVNSGQFWSQDILRHHNICTTDEDGLPSFYETSSRFDPDYTEKSNDDEEYQFSQQSIPDLASTGESNSETGYPTNEASDAANDMLESVENVSDSDILASGGELEEDAKMSTLFKHNRPRSELHLTRLARLQEYENLYTALLSNTLDTIDEPSSSEDPQNIYQAWNRGQGWKDSIEAEFSGLEKKNSWIVLDGPSQVPKDKNIIKSTWSFRSKRSERKVYRLKSRLCAAGYSQKKGIDFQETFAPVGSKLSLRTFISFAARKRLKMRQMDVEMAFLEGELPENEVVYMLPPPGIELIRPELEGKIFQLKKSLYN